MSLLSHEFEKVRTTLDAVMDRSMHTQAATLEREVDWVHKVIVEATTKSGRNVLTFTVLRHDGTWENVYRTRGGA